MTRARPVFLALLALAGPGSASGEASPPAEAVVSVERIVGGAGSARRGVLSWITGSAPAPPFVRPYGVAWDGDDLLVTDPGASRVVRVSASGKETSSPRGLFRSPIGIAACPGGIAVTDSHEGTVTILDARLRRTRVLAERLDRPTGIACANDRIYVVETGRHRVVVLSGGGKPEGSMARRGSGDGELNFPSALALADGLLWVGDTLNFRIQRLKADDGSFGGAFGALGDAPGETPQVKGIAVDPAGRLWVTDAVLDSVVVFRDDGTFLAHVGGPGRDPGQFSFPAGVAAHRDGRVAVVDSLNRRVQVVRLETPRGGER